MCDIYTFLPHSQPRRKQLVPYNSNKSPFGTPHTLSKDESFVSYDDICTSFHPNQKLTVGKCCADVRVRGTPRVGVVVKIAKRRSGHAITVRLDAGPVVLLPSHSVIPLPALNEFVRHKRTGHYFKVQSCWIFLGFLGLGCSSPSLPLLLTLTPPPAHTHSPSSPHSKVQLTALSIITLQVKAHATMVVLLQVYQSTATAATVPAPNPTPQSTAQATTATVPTPAPNPTPQTTAPNPTAQTPAPAATATVPTPAPSPSPQTPRPATTVVATTASPAGYSSMEPRLVVMDKKTTERFVKYHLRTGIPDMTDMPEVPHDSMLYWKRKKTKDRKRAHSILEGLCAK